MEGWTLAEVVRLTALHGTVPPPWVMYDEHPYSICWRMGGGEGHIMVWWEWWPEQVFTIEERIGYFFRWPPPHCWLPFLIQAIWGVEGGEDDEALLPYFQHTALLGFGSYEHYERDLNDPSWHEG